MSFISQIVFDALAYPDSGTSVTLGNTRKKHHPIHPIKSTFEKYMPLCLLVFRILYFYKVASNSLLGVMYSKSFNYRELIKYAMQGLFCSLAIQVLISRDQRQYQEYLSKFKTFRGAVSCLQSGTEWKIHLFHQIIFQVFPFLSKISSSALFVSPTIQIASPESLPL